MLRARYADDPTITIYHDLVFQWDHPDVKSYAPDVAVVPNVRDPQAERGEFVVAAEATRPRLIVEVVSPSSREGDGCALYCETVNLRIGIEDGQVWLEDADTGQDLLTNLKAQQALRATSASSASRASCSACRRSRSCTPEGFA